MNAKTDTEASGGLNLLKWIVVAVLVIAGIAGNIYFGDESLLYRVLGLVAIGLLAAFVAIQTTQGGALWSLAKESRTEIRKVIWPTRQEATQTTLIVVAFVLIMGLILWGLDSLFSRLVALILG